MADFELLTDTELLRSLGISLPARIESLRRRATGAGSSVAVVGLFSRGKSTFFNHLVGASIADVGALPTTKLLTEASTGQRFAAAYWPDRSKQLPLQPEGFTKAIAELGAPYPERVEISGPFRLPAGMRLVDTPGAGAVSDLNERDWYLSGAGAAVLLLALPPGPQGEDWDLLAGLDEVFPNANAIVLKGTSGEVERRDLEEVRSRAELNCGRPIVIAPSEAPTGGWGEDPAWQAVESLLGELEQAARNGTVDAAAELRTWLDGRFAEITVDELSAAGRTVAVADAIAAPGASDGALRALERLGNALREDQLRQQEAAAAAARDAEVAQLAVLTPRHDIGTQLLQECNQWRSVPYQALRIHVGDLHQLLVRVDHWRRGRTGASYLLALEAAVDTAHASLSDLYGALLADDLLDRGNALFTPRRTTPAEAWRVANIWIDDAQAWIDTAGTGDVSNQRAQHLRSLLARIRG